MHFSPRTSQWKDFNRKPSMLPTSWLCPGLFKSERVKGHLRYVLTCEFCYLHSLHSRQTPRVGWFPGSIRATLPSEGEVALYRGATWFQSRRSRQLRGWEQKEWPTPSDDDSGLAEVAQTEAHLEGTDRGSHGWDCGWRRGCSWPTGISDDGNRLVIVHIHTATLFTPPHNKHDW